MQRLRIDFGHSAFHAPPCAVLRSKVRPYPIGRAERGGVFINKRQRNASGLLAIEQMEKSSSPCCFAETMGFDNEVYAIVEVSLSTVQNGQVASWLYPHLECKMVERRPYGFFRLPNLESLEERQLMAVDVRLDVPVALQAPTVILACQPVTVTERVSESTQSLDVDGDGRISNLDYLAILDHLSQPPVSGPLDMEGETTPSSDGFDSLEKMDVNADGEIAPLDVLIVANRIQLYNPLTPCTCGACIGSNPGTKCESTATVSKQAEVVSVELAPQWQP